jgi:hypothetical protein
MGKPSDGRKKRRRGDVEAAINAYMKQSPNAQYFEMLNDLHAQGYRLHFPGFSALGSHAMQLYATGWRPPRHAR